MTDTPSQGLMDRLATSPGNEWGATRFCADCAHFTSFPQIAGIGVYIPRRDICFGVLEPVHGAGTDAEFQRKLGACGMEAKLFIQKPHAPVEPPRKSWIERLCTLWRA